MEQLVFPDGVAAVVGLVDGGVFAGYAVGAGAYMTSDSYNALLGTPYVTVSTDGGQPGFVDQVEQLTLQVDGPAGHAKRVALAIKSALVGQNVSTPAGFLDSVRCDRLPTVQQLTDQLDRAVLLVTVVSRPLI